MEIQERIEKFVEYGISLGRIADAANVNKNTMTAIRKGDSVNPRTVEKIKGGLKDIALELYNTAFADEVGKDEEWED